VVRGIAPAIALLAAAWVLLLVAAPFLPPLLSAMTYAFGSVICHQIAERSFHLHTYQLPVCARCVGLYSGAALAGAWVALRRAILPLWPAAREARLITAVAAIPTLVTVVLEWAGWWQPSNVTRAMAGVPLGAAVAYVVLRALRQRGEAAPRPTLHYD
jgi:uncharacterized membrane protein